MPAPTAIVAREQADALVDPGGGRGQRAGEGDVAEGVAGEHLPAQHDEPAATPQASAMKRARQQRVAHEFLREHQAITPAGAGSARAAAGPRRAGRVRHAQPRTST